MSSEPGAHVLSQTNVVPGWLAQASEDVHEAPTAVWHVVVPCTHGSSADPGRLLGLDTLSESGRFFKIRPKMTRTNRENRRKS